MKNPRRQPCHISDVGSCGGCAPCPAAPRPARAASTPPARALYTRRRLLALSASLLAWPLSTAAQPAGKVYRVGLLGTDRPENPLVARLREAIRQGLQEHGLVEGQHVTLEFRWARGNFDLLPELAADLVRSGST